MEFVSEIIKREEFGIECGYHTKDGILFVLNGSFECIINGERYTIGENGICIFRKNTFFRRRVLQKLTCVYLQFEELPAPLPDGLLRLYDAARAENTIRYLAKAVAEENRKLTEHFLWDIFFLYQCQTNETVCDDRIVSSCLEYFSENYGERITLDMLSEKFYISKQGLIKKFKKHIGKTPMEQLCSVRISQSKRLLKNTGLSVGEISEKCGFASLYYFSKSFKHLTGFAPTDYRKFVNL